MGGLTSKSESPNLVHNWLRSARKLLRCWGVLPGIVRLEVVFAGQLMVGAVGVQPYYHAGRLPRRAAWGPINSCPASLQDLLAVNNMVLDDTTSRDGNCGISAFTISIMGAMSSRTSTKKDTSPEARRLGCLRRCPHGQRVIQARAAGVQWLHENATAKLWENMTVSQLVRHVSGEDLATYRARMKVNGEWADTVFMHALACAYGVTVLVFQEQCDPAILGPHLHEDLEQDCDVVVPVALVNDYHFWAVVESRLPGLGCTLARDKGEFLAFQSDAAAREYSLAEMEEDGQEHHPSWAPPPSARSKEEIDKELQFCAILSTWCPWSEPTAQTVHAIQCMAQDSHDSDVSSKCLARRRALQALAYEDAYRDKLPETLRYQRGARRHLLNPKEWRCAVRNREVTRKYVDACAKLPAMDALAWKLESQHPCGSTTLHAKCCVGIDHFSPAVVHNWRVMWFSLPSNSRRERLLKAMRNNLEQHRQEGGTDEQWRMKFKFLGCSVCQVAFLGLTGISKWMLAHCRDGAIQGKQSFVTATEIGLHASLQKPNGGYLQTYLSARQWLEHYSSTHAEMSPMDEKAYLPSGRKMFYYYQYRKEMIERSEPALGKEVREESVLGSTPGQSGQEVHEESSLRCTPGQRSGTAVPPPPSGPPTGQRSRKRKSLGGDAALGSTPRRAAARADIVMATLPTFLQAWRVECPWIVVAKSVGMFTRCSVCDYLKLLIEQTSRDQHDLREFLKDRLGQHFDFQAAQRLAHGRVEEHAAQSAGEHWFMLIDKMDQRKTVIPSVWSQLRTPLFKEVDKRLVTGLIGAMWFGTNRMTHHVRTVFDDCGHGAEMQCSALLFNLYQTAIEEGHLPKQWSIGADNTRKETKNQVTMWMLVWLLCALHDTPLWMIDVVFLMVGHTHNKLDRFFSRIAVALAGRDYFTVVGMLNQIRASLACDVKSGHLSQVWAWNELKEHKCVAPMHNLDPVHAFRFFRSGGIYMQWKQWCTDEQWSPAVLLVPEADVPSLASFRPPCRDMEFSAAQSMLDWINRFEVWCSSQPVGKYKDFDQEFQWLRAIVSHQVPGEYSPGTTVDALLQELKDLPHARPEGPRAPGSLQSDTITQLFPGADILPIPAENLVRIDGVTHAPPSAGGRPIRSNLIHPGSLLLVRVPENTHVQDRPVKFLVAEAMETSARLVRDQQIVVVWYVPGLAPVENFRGGTKKKILDIFGPWTSYQALTVPEIKKCSLPQPVVALSQILECNFDLSDAGTLPYDVFDALRIQHNIDVTGFSQSMTHKGNLYRNYALLGGRV